MYNEVVGLLPGRAPRAPLIAGGGRRAPRAPRAGRNWAANLTGKLSFCRERLGRACRGWRFEETPRSK